MKHTIITILCASFFLIPGCNSTTQHAVKTDPYPNLNVEFVSTNCNPEERYQFPVFGTLAMPARAKNCAGIDDLWMVAWPGENTELEQSISKVLTILYVRSSNEQKDKGPDIKTTFIRYSSNSENTIHAAFYEITEVPVKSEQSKPQE